MCKPVSVIQYLNCFFSLAKIGYKILQIKKFHLKTNLLCKSVFLGP